MKTLPWLLGAALAVLLAVSAHQDQALHQADTARDSALGVATLRTQAAQQLRDSVAQAAPRIQTRLVYVTRPQPIAPPAPTAPDSVRYWRDSARVVTAKLDTLTLAFTAQAQALAQLEHADTLDRSAGATVTQQLEQMPSRCPRLPVLGIPTPRPPPAAGVGVHGWDLIVGVGVSLGRC